MSLADSSARWLVASAVTAIIAAVLVPGARGQSGLAGPSFAPAEFGANPPPPHPTVADSANVPTTGPAATLPPATGLSALEVIRASLFDDIYSPEAQARWTPLSLGSFFSEGWDTPFALPVVSTGGAPRQGWVGAFDGQLFRAWFFAFAYDQGINQKVGNGYVGRYTIFAPFNRRFMFQLDSLFIVSNKGGPNNNYHGNIGDTNFWAVFQLSETKDFGQTFKLGFITPTGQAVNGQGQNSIWPKYSFLWFPFQDGKWMMRAETGPIVPLSHTGAHTQYQNVLALGRYFPGSKESWFQQWWFYLVATQTSTVAGTPRHETGFTLLPGMRCKIPGLAEKVGTGLWYFFADVNVPMTGPQSFSYQPIFAVLYDY